MRYILCACSCSVYNKNATLYVCVIVQQLACSCGSVLAFNIIITSVVFPDFLTSRLLCLSCVVTHTCI